MQKENMLELNQLVEKLGKNIDGEIVTIDGRKGFKWVYRNKENNKIESIIAY